jgi:hypothetical protein
MRRAALTHLLLLLVAFAALDDVCAAATADASDDVAAAEDNEFLASTFSPAEDPRDATTLAPLCLAATDGASHETAVGAGAGPPELGALSDLYPLYIFTSMRC